MKINAIFAKMASKSNPFRFTMRDSNVMDRGAPVKNAGRSDSGYDGQSSSYRRQNRNAPHPYHGYYYHKGKHSSGGPDRHG